MKLITIIVPIYNIEKYIERCIESIIAQTYKNLEIILVDDGSTDQSGRICDVYAKQDKRIKVIHKENGGLSDARNAGLDIAGGEYIGFVDGDDYIDGDMYETLWKEMIDESIDIASCGMEESWGDIKHLKCLSKNTVILDRVQAYAALFSRTTILGGTNCNKLFRKRVLEGLKYKKGIQSEDIEFLYRVLDRAEKVVCIDKVKYHYVHRENSITTTPFSKSYMDIIKTMDEMVEFINKNYPQLSKKVYAYQVNWLIGGLKGIQMSGENFFSLEKKILYQKIKDNINIYWKNRYIYWGDYILMWAAMLHMFNFVQKALTKSACIYHNMFRIKGMILCLIFY